MAIINNTVQPGMISASTPNAQYLSGITLNPNQPAINAQNSINTAARTTAGLTAPVSGLVSPAHPTVTPASGSTISSHTYTTNPDGSATTKITYAPNDSAGTATATNNAGTSNAPAPNTNQANTPATNTGNPFIPPLADAALPSTTQTGLISNLSNAAQGNTAIGQQAANILDRYGQLFKNIGQQGAALESGQLTTGTSPVARGNAAVTAQNVAEQQTAAAQGAQTALQGVNAELTGQSQLQSGLTSALGGANVQQQQELSGLSSAAGLAQPSATAFGQTVFNPLTGQFENNGGLPPEVMAQYAQMAANGQYSAIPSSIVSNPVLSAQLNAAAKAINPNFNPIASTAQGSAQAQNITAGGTAITSANAQGLQQSITQETQLNTAVTNATTLGQQVQEALGNAGLDMTNSTDANTLINNLQSRLGSAAYTQLNIAVNDARNAYGAILQAAGATPTDAGAAAQQNINANMSPKQILAAIDQLSKGMQSRQSAAHQQTQQFLGQLGGSSAGSTSSGGTITTKNGLTINPNL